MKTTAIGMNNRRATTIINATKITHCKKKKKKKSPDESHNARYLRAVRRFRWPVLTSIHFNAPILSTANCPFVANQSLKNKTKHPHSKIATPVGKKQTNQQKVGGSHQLLAEAQIHCRTASWGASGAQCSAPHVKDHLLRPTWITPVRVATKLPRELPWVPLTVGGGYSSSSAAVFCD